MLCVQRVKNKAPFRKPLLGRWDLAGCHLGQVLVRNTAPLLSVPDASAVKSHTFLDFKPLSDAQPISRQTLNAPLAPTSQGSQPDLISFGHSRRSLT